MDIIFLFSNTEVKSWVMLCPMKLLNNETACDDVFPLTPFRILFDVVFEAKGPLWKTLE